MNSIISHNKIQLDSTILIHPEEISENISAINTSIHSQKKKHPGNITPNVTLPYASIHNFESLSIALIIESMRQSILSLSKLNTTIQENVTLYDSLRNEFQLQNIRDRAINKANNFQLPSEIYSNDYNNLKSFNFNWNDFIKSYVNTDRFNILMH
jgi:hypothetical protein